MKRKRIRSEEEGVGRARFAKRPGEKWLVRSTVLHRERLRLGVFRKIKRKSAWKGWSSVLGAE